MTLRDADPDPRRRRWRPRARARLEAGPRARRRTRCWSRPGAPAIATEPRVRCHGRRPARPGRGRRRWRGRDAVGARRRRAGGAAGGRRGRCAGARPGSRSSGRTRGRAGSRRRRRSATRSRRRPGSGWHGRGRSPAGEAAAAQAFVRELDARRRGAVLKADGLAGGQGRDRHANRPSRRSSSCRRSSRVARPDAPALVIEERLEGREASVIAICDGTRAVALPAARDHKRLCDGDTRPEHRRHGRLLAAAGPRRRRRRARARDRPPADPRRDGPPRVPVPRLPLRRPDAHRRRPGPPRVQRPARRPRGAGDPAADRRLPRAVAARRRQRAPPGRRARPASPSCPARRGRHRPGGQGLPGRPAPRRPDRRARAAPSSEASSCSTPGPSGGRRAATARTAAGCSRSSGAGATSPPPARRPSGPRTRSRGTASSAATTSPRDLPQPAEARRMIPRYTLPEMGARVVGAGALRADARGRARGLPGAGAARPRARGRPSRRSRAGRASTSTRIAEIERTTDHDVIAFVSAGRRDGRARGPVPPPGPDQQRRRGHGARPPAPRRGRRASSTTRTGSSPPSSTRARIEAGTVMMGRTHSVHAEPTTFGLKCAGWAFEVARGRARLAEATAEIATGKISGPVGTYSHLGAGHRGGGPRRTSGCAWTRSAPRSSSATGTRRSSRPSRSSAARSSGSRPRSATSSTPRSPRSWSRSARARRAARRCPTSATRSCPSGSPGSPACCAATPRPASRTSRCGTSATSATARRSGSRCPTPRSCSTTCSSARPGLVDGLVVRPERMRENIERGLGLHASSRVLLALVERGGLSREDAYAHRPAQRPAGRGRARVPAATCSRPTRSVAQKLPLAELDACFDDATLLRHVPEVIARLDAPGGRPMRLR